MAPASSSTGSWQRWEKARRFAGCSIGVAVYSLLDVIVDGYFDTIDRFEAFYDEAADQVFGEHPIEPTKHRHWFEMRRALNQFDRIVRPLTEALDDRRRPGPRALRHRRPRRTCATPRAS